MAQHALAIAKQCFGLAGVRQLSCIRSTVLSTVLNQLGAFTRFVGNTQQLPLPIAPFYGPAVVRAQHTDALKDALDAIEQNKAPVSGAVGAVKAAGSALTALLGRLRLVARPQDLQAASVFELNKAAVVCVLVPRGASLLPSAVNQEASFSASGPGQKPRLELGTGTGFFVRHSTVTGKTVDLILTSYQNVKGSIIPGMVTVRLPPDEKTTHVALVVGGDMALDVAVLMAMTETTQQEKMQPLQPPHVVTLGSSSGLRVGQRVFALGSPPDLDKTFSSGVIGGLTQTVPWLYDGRTTTREGSIQTTVVTSPGCSGGPLLDAAGHVVGINTGWGGWTYAVPIDEVKELLDQKGLLPALAVAAKAMGATMVLDGDRPGLVVTTVIPYSAAAHSGLKPTTRDCPGDKIVGIDGQPVRSYADLVHALSGKRAGDIITLDILRSHHTAPAGSGGVQGSTDGAQQPQPLRQETVKLTVR